MPEPNTLLSCIPGVEKIERLDERTYDCMVKQKVGPISVRFKFKSITTKLDAPNHLEFESQGKEGATGAYPSL